MATVYAHVNKTNGKIYIGQTVHDSVNRRWRSGKGYDNCVLFSKAIQKYGWDGFDHVVLYSGITSERALELECFLIAMLDTNNQENGYNLTTGGEHSIPSEIVRRKLSKAVSGVNNGMYGRTGELNPYYGKKHTEEERYKMSLKASHPAWNKGIPMTEAARKRLSDACKGRPSPNKGKHFSEEFREKQRRIQTGLKHVPHTEQWKQQNKKRITELRDRYLEAISKGEFAGTWNEYQSLNRNPNRK